MNDLEWKITWFGVTLVLLFGFGGILLGTLGYMSGNEKAVMVIPFGLLLMWCIGYPLAVGPAIIRGLRIVFKKNP